MSESRGYDKLHYDVKRWIAKQHWPGLRDIQEQAIEPILQAQSDVIISASTASGKTEAAFLPACSRIAELKLGGVGILYISPLKALINDQHRRLEGLCEEIDVPLTSWHGDALQSQKKKQKKVPHGIILITPESLESLLLNYSGWCLHAFTQLSHIISKSLTEILSTTLTNQCERLGVPNEFFPHHGNLAKELREPLEQRLQEGKLPTTAICTATLELGIDIGSVDSVAQVNPPFSVASFRQRIGRSGRRGNEAVVRIFIIEHEINGSSCWLDNLRLGLVQSIAIVSLLHKKWYEPPEIIHYHLSTLVQQILAVIGQYGSARANQLWLLLCDSGPFNLVSKACFVKILKSLADKQLIARNSLI